LCLDQGWQADKGGGGKQKPAHGKSLRECGGL
jgi:hypothetical protein